MAFKGIDIRQTSDRLVFRSLLQDSTGALLTTGTSTVKLYELQSDGTLKSYDFNDNTFKTTALTTETLAMTHRTGNNATTNTGVWTAILTTLTGFSEGNLYFAMVNNTAASPRDQQREFQFGSVEGDLTVSVAGNLDTNIAEVSDDATAADNLEAQYDGSGVMGDTYPATQLQIGQVMDDGVASFDRSTDSLQAIRDRGDSSWNTVDNLSVDPLIPYSIDVANTALVRLGLMLRNALADLPSTAEITPGTIDIARKAIGGTAWSTVVNGAACSEIDGLIYYDEVFDAGSGYAEGDSIRITFKNQKVTVGGNDQEIIGGTGRFWYTSIRQTSTGSSAATIADAVWDEARSGHVAAGSFGEAFGAVVTQSGKVVDVSANAHEFDTDLISQTEGHYDGQLLVMTSGSAKGQVVPILHYEGFTGKLRFAWPLRTAPGNDSEFVIVPAGRMGLPGLVLETTIGTAISQTVLDLRAAPGSDDDYNGMTAGVIRASTGQVSYRTITDFVASSKTITLASAPDFTVANNDIVQILGNTPPTTGDVADAVLDELLSGHQAAGSVGAELHLVKAMLANKRTHTISTGVDQVMDDDGSTVLRTMTPTDGGDDTITVTPS